MCEGVGEDSRYGIRHVDIQVGSCIYLNVFGCHYMCTWVGSNPYRGIQLLDITHRVGENYFRYRECSGIRRLLEAAFKKKVGLCL